MQRRLHFFAAKKYYKFLENESKDGEKINFLRREGPSALLES